MASIRIVLSPAGLPQMLHGILRELLARNPGIEVVAAGPAQAIVTGDAAEALAALEAGVVERALVLDPDGSRAALYLPDRPPSRLDDLSTDALLAALELAPRSRRVLIRRLFGRRPPLRPAPPPSGPPPAGLAAELARLAARILRSRGDEAPAQGPAADLVALARTLAARAPSRPARPAGLVRAASLFGLTEAETDLVFLAALVEADPQAARLVALLNDHHGRPRPTIGLAHDLGGDPAAIAARAGPDGPFQRFDLARFDGDVPLSQRPVIVPADLWPLLLDLPRRPPFDVAEIAERLDALALPAGMAEDLAAVADGLARRPESDVVVCVTGAEDTGRLGIACGLAARLRRRRVLAQGAALADAAAVARLRREAALADAAVIVEAAGAAPPAQWSEMTRGLGAPLFASCARSETARLTRDAATPPLEVAAPPRDRDQRLRHWRASSPVDWSERDLAALADRFDFGGRGVATAMSLARRRGEAEGVEPSPAAARLACESLREIRFAGTARALPCPFEPADIVLRAETRAELDLAVAWARHRASLFGADGAARRLHTGSGLACLFSGPPGTGKTMAAQIVAREVDYELYRIDLSQVIDKFIGESEKRLAQVFDEAERARVALFFDEADALFGKRTEVKDSHDRYANITVDFLLQRLETFEGLAILATNLAGNLDEAFLRRVQIRADFARPDAAGRRAIWEKLLPENRAADIDVGVLAGPFDLAGGEIRNAVYAAHLLAAGDGGPVAMRHCVRGLWRELGRVGRIADPADLGLWRRALAA